MGNCNKRRIAGMNSKVEISADVSVFADDDFEMIFFGKIFNVVVGGSGGDEYVAVVGLIES